MHKLEQTIQHKIDNFISSLSSQDETDINSKLAGLKSIEQPQ